MRESGSGRTAQIFAAIVIAGVVVAASIFGSAYYSGSRARPSPSAQSSSCGRASYSLPAAPAAFLVQVNYSAMWSAVLVGYAGVGLGGNQTQQFSACYTGDGNGFISVPEWNTTTVKLLSGSSQVDDTLFLAVSKMDGSNGNLTAWLDGGPASTTAPFGSVHLEATM